MPDEAVSMEDAERILAEWFQEHSEHDTFERGKNWHVETWCEACREGHSFKIDGLRSEVGRQLRENGAVMF